MAQWVKCVPYKCEDLSLDSQHPCNNLGQWPCAPTMLMEMWTEDPWSSLACYPSLVSQLQIQWRTWHQPLASTCMCTHVHLHPHTCTHKSRMCTQTNTQILPHVHTHILMVGMDVLHDSVITASGWPRPHETQETVHLHLTESPAAIQHPSPAVTHPQGPHSCCGKRGMGGGSLCSRCRPASLAVSYSYSCVSRWSARPPATPPNPHNKSCVHNTPIYLHSAVSKETAELGGQGQCRSACMGPRLI